MTRRLMSGGDVLEEVEIPLAAIVQEAQFIEEVFTRIDTSENVGSVSCTAPHDGIFTGIAVELDAGNRIGHHAASGAGGSRGPIENRPGAGSSCRRSQNLRSTACPYASVVRPTQAIRAVWCLGTSGDRAKGRGRSEW